MKRLLLAVLGLFVLGLGAWAADSYFIKYKVDTQEERRLKLIDNGDGTYSLSVDPLPGALVGKTYAVHSKTIISAPDSLTFYGVGASWAFEVEGGSATFTVSGSSSTVAFQGKMYSSDFKLSPTNPSISVSHLEAGATAQLIIDGGV